MMKLDAEGRLTGDNVRWHASPYFDERVAGAPIDLVVIHNISLPCAVYGTGYVEALFDGTLDTRAFPTFKSLEGLEVSSHFFIDRQGAVTQFVSTQKRAWHAGKSDFMGRTRCNDFSIGIEVEGCDFYPFDGVQYESLKSLLKAILHRYPSVKFITGHADIAPGRKTDPGPYFDWGFLARDEQLSSQLKYWHL